MTIEQTNVIDFLTLEHVTGDVLLSISDHLEWEPGTDEEGEHLWLLQEKINKYLAAMESGEIFEKYPEMKGRKLVINIVGKYPLSGKATFFFEKAKGFVEAAGFELRFEHVTE